MKKAIALLLSLSMISALAGCKKKSEETTKKTKKTTETEVTETEAEESETETEATSEDTEPSESESSSEPETKPGTGLKDFKLSSDFIVRNDQKNLEYEFVSTDRAFAVPTSDGRFGMIRKDASKIQFSDAEIEAHDQLWNTLESQSAELNYVLDGQYDTLRPQLVSSIKDGSFSTDTHLNGAIWVYRADTDIFSYAIHQEIYSASLNNNSVISHTYRASDGMEYFFEDVVTDRAGFADFFEKFFSSSKADEYEKGYAKDFAKDLRNENEKIEFVISYDAIYLINTKLANPHFFKIPAMYAADYLDVSIFGSTPEYYALEADAYNSITWDIDGDGALDLISVDYETDEYGAMIGANISINGEAKGAIPGDLLGNGDNYYYYGFNLMKTDSGFYAYLATTYEGESASTFVFHYENGQFVYVNDFVSTFGYNDVYGISPYYDPSRFVVHDTNDIMGTTYIDTTCSVIGNNGMPVKTADFASKQGVGISKKEITATKIDENGNPAGTITIPANTAISLIGVDLEKDLGLFTTLEEDESTNTVFQLKVTISDGYKIAYGDEQIPQEDLFSGIRYAG